MELNFNNVVDDQPNREPIPDKTVVRCLMNIEPGGVGDGGYYSLSQAKHHQLKVKFTVLVGQYAGKFFTDYLFCDPNNGAYNYSRSKIKAMIEDIHDLDPSDTSEEACVKRVLKSIGELDKIEVCLSVTIKGQYNKIGFIVPRSNENYVPKTKIAQSANSRPSLNTGVIPPSDPAPSGVAPEWMKPN